MARYEDLQESVQDIADRLAGIRNAASPHESAIYAELHETLLQGVQKLIDEQSVLPAVTPPQTVDLAFDRAKEVRNLILRQAAIHLVSSAVTHLAATISALPGKSTTGGGGPIG